MPLITLTNQVQPLFRAGQGSVLVVNNEETHPIYVSNQQGITTSDIAVPAQASITLDGSQTWYGSTLANNVGAAEVYVFPGGTNWQNPVGVQIALSALGLALDTTVQATNSQLGTGVAPAIPNVASATSLGSGPGVGAIFTFPSPGRIWAAQISYAIVTNTSYSAGMQSQTYARMLTGSGITLAVCEAGVSGPSDSNSNGSGLVINGVAVNGGDTIKIDVNNGVTITNAVQRASGVVLYSIP